MSWASDTKLRLQFAALIFSVMGPAFLISLAPATLRQIASKSWPAVSGTIAEVVVKRETNSEQKLVQVGRAVYRYEVDGKPYTSDLMSLDTAPQHSDYQAALSDVNHYQVGQQVTVYYDPQDPQSGILTPGIPERLVPLLIGLLVVSAVSIVASVFTIRAWLAHRRQRWAALAIDDQWEIPIARQLGMTGDAQLGEVIDTFQPNRPKLYGYLLVCVALLVLGTIVQGWIALEIWRVGANMPFYVEKGMCWVAAGLGSLIPSGMIGGGVFLAWYIPRLFSYRVEICQHGLREQRGSFTQEIAWADVAALRVTGEGHQVFRHDKRKHSFNAVSISDYERFGTLLRQQAELHGVMVVVEEA